MKVSTNQQSITGKFMAVDITNDQLPLLVRDWLRKLRLNWPKLLGYNSVNKMDSMTLKSEFPDVFKPGARRPVAGARLVS